jgi:hypothetical protein
MQMLNTGLSILNTEACKMKKFLKELWASWQEVQLERARFYAEHGDQWE